MQEFKNGKELKPHNKKKRYHYYIWEINGEYNSFNYSSWGERKRKQAIKNRLSFMKCLQKLTFFDWLFEDTFTWGLFFYY